MLKSEVYSPLPEQLDDSLLVPDGEHLLDRVKGHGCGLVGVAVHQRPGPRGEHFA